MSILLESALSRIEFLEEERKLLTYQNKDQDKEIANLKKELKCHTDPVEQSEVEDEVNQILDNIDGSDDDDWIFIPNANREFVIINMLHGSEVRVKNLTKSNTELDARVSDLENLCVAKTTNEDFANLKMNEMATRLNALIEENGKLKRKNYKLKQSLASKSNEFEVSENARKTLKRKRIETISLDD